MRKRTRRAGRGGFAREIHITITPNGQRLSVVQLPMVFPCPTCASAATMADTASTCHERTPRRVTTSTTATTDLLIARHDQKPRSAQGHEGKTPSRARTSPVTKRTPRRVTTSTTGYDEHDGHDGISLIAPPRGTVATHHPRIAALFVIAGRSRRRPMTVPRSLIAAQACAASTRPPPRSVPRF
jgi:hypothetical protein